MLDLTHPDLLRIVAAVRADPTCAAIACDQLEEHFAATGVQDMLAEVVRLYALMPHYRQDAIPLDVKASVEEFGIGEPLVREWVFLGKLSPDRHRYRMPCVCTFDPAANISLLSDSLLVTPRDFAHVDMESHDYRSPDGKRLRCWFGQCYRCLKIYWWQPPDQLGLAPFEEDDSLRPLLVAWCERSGDKQRAGRVLAWICKQDEAARSWMVIGAQGVLLDGLPRSVARRELKRVVLEEFDEDVQIEIKRVVWREIDGKRYEAEAPWICKPSDLIPTELAYGPSPLREAYRHLETAELIADYAHQVIVRGARDETNRGMPNP